MKLFKSILKLEAPALLYLIAGAYFTFLFIDWATPIATINDFWWHLSTGRFIFENGALPATDPFSQVVDNPATPRQLTILQGYWLAQLIYFGLYQLFGWTGVIILKSLIFVTIALLLWRLLLKKNVTPLLALLATLPLFFLSDDFVPLRPRGFSFLGFTLLIYLLESRRLLEREREQASATGSIRRDSLLPSLLFWLVPLFLFWSNLHPGYVIGLVVLACYSGSAFWSYWRERSPATVVQLKETLILSGVSLVAALINPNSFRLLNQLTELRRDDKFLTTVSEYFNPFQYAALFNNYDYLAGLLLLLAGVTALLILFRRRVTLIHLLLVIAFSLAALLFYRFGIYFAIVAIAIGGQYLSLIREQMMFYLSRAALPIIIVAILLNIRSSYFQSFINAGQLDPIAPDRVVNYLKKERLPGPLLHPYEWGGFLTWHLAGEQKVFVDSRTLNYHVYQDYQRLRRSPEPMVAAVLKRYQIKSVATFYIYHGINQVPGDYLIYLLRSPEWEVTYYDNQSVILIRADEIKSSAINKKEKFINMVQSGIWQRIGLNSQNPQLYLLAALFSFAAGEDGRAVRLLNQVLQLSPDDQEARYWRKKIIAE